MKLSDNIVPFPDAEQVEQLAAEWAVRLAEEELSQDDKAAFQAWYAASARHRDAFSRLSQLWKRSDLLAELVDHAAADVTRASRTEEPVRSRAIRSLSGWHSHALLAAGLATIAVLTWGARQDSAMAPAVATMDGSAYETVAETALGERRTVTLPDGSVVELNTASRVAVRYTAEARLVSLTRGEAHFTVAHNPQRPFSVHAADRSITAVGTAFTVQVRSDAAVEVIVAEGRVALAESPAHDAQIRSSGQIESLPALEAGQIALLGQGGRHVAVLAPAELQRKLAWRQGMLAFAGEPLLQVLHEIERYTDVDIEITDPALRNLPVAGRLRIDDVENMLQALQLMADVRVERLNDRHVRLRAKRKG